MNRTTKIANDISKALILTSVTIIAPNAIQALGKIIKFSDEENLKHIVKYMSARKYVEVKELDDGLQEIKITEKGKARYKKMNFVNLRIKKPKKWDKKWRIVIFDIPESYKTARNALSVKLRELGFIQLQKSVWVHPFACGTEIELIKENYSINSFVTYLETNSIDRHNYLLKKFKKVISKITFMCYST